MTTGVRVIISSVGIIIRAITADIFTGSLLALSAVLLFAPLSIHHAAEALIGILK